MSSILTIIPMDYIYPTYKVIVTTPNESIESNIAQILRILFIVIIVVTILITILIAFIRSSRKISGKVPIDVLKEPTSDIKTKYAELPVYQGF